MISELVEMTAAAIAGIDSDDSKTHVTISIHTQKFMDLEVVADRLIGLGYNQKVKIVDSLSSDDYYIVWKFWPSSSSEYNAVVIFSPHANKAYLENFVGHYADMARSTR